MRSNNDLTVLLFRVTHLAKSQMDKPGTAYRVHGGGFAGTVQAFVPNDMVDEFKTKIEAVFGEGMCHILTIRPVGGTELR